MPEPYKIDIAQGNKFDREEIEQLETGMTERQVRYLLGSPMIQDIFHPNRWDYIYSFNPGKGEIEKKHLRLFFEQGKLHRFELFTPKK